MDAETQARLEALLEAAGIGKLSGETKQLTDPDVSTFRIIPYLLIDRWIIDRPLFIHVCSFCLALMLISLS